MKNTILLGLTFLFLIACESKQTIIDDQLALLDPIVGEWQQIEQKVSIGGPATWQIVENGEIFSLQEDGHFSGFQLFSDCMTGTYEATEDELTLTYNCQDGTKPFTYALRKKDETIILSPKTVICTEICEYKYQKKKN